LLTAIISDATTVHLVKVGETVTGYVVIEITGDSATIENAAGARWKLRLK
jgi:microcompartment protein CcmL/EutN